MTDREINEGLAKAIGWVLCEHIQEYRPWDGARDCDFIPVRNFSPATSVDALRKWVLPELVRLGVFSKWCELVDARTDRDTYRLAKKMFENEVGFYKCHPAAFNACLSVFEFLSLSPAVLAAAALEVLEEDNAVN